MKTRKAEQGLELPRLLRDKEGALRWRHFCEVAGASPGITIEDLSKEHYDHKGTVNRLARILKACVTNLSRESERETARLALKRYARARRRRRHPSADVLAEMQTVLEEGEENQ